MIRRNDDVLETLRNPMRGALRQLDEFTGHGSAQRLAREASTLTRYLREMQGPCAERQLQDASHRLSACAGVCEELQAMTRAILPDAFDWSSAMAIFERWRDEKSEALETWRRHQSCFGSLVDQANPTQMSQRLGAASPRYAANLARSGAITTSANRALQDTDFWTALEPLRQAAVALAPLQRLSESLAHSFGSALSMTELQRQWEDGRATWVRDYCSFAALVEDAMNLEDVAESEFDEAASVAEVRWTESPSRDPQVAERLWTVALRYTLPAFELNAQLTRLASRVDPKAIGGQAGWDLMVLAIGHAFPSYRQELMELAYPLLQHLSWRNAPCGSGVGATIEALSLEDAESFGVLVLEMLRVLAAIEKSLSD